MTPNQAEVLSAFFDGEPVDPAHLAESLRDGEANEYLVEFARLRQAVHEDASRPTEEFSEALRDRLARAERRQAMRQRLVPLALAASLVLAAAAGGFGVRALLERQAQPPAASSTTASRLPAQPRVERSEPAPLPAAPAPPAASASSRSRVPSATLRMRFASWRDKVL